jgi:hypothetical protein
MNFRSGHHHHIACNSAARWWRPVATKPHQGPTAAIHLTLYRMVFAPPPSLIFVSTTRRHVSPPVRALLCGALHVSRIWPVLRIFKLRLRYLRRISSRREWLTLTATEMTHVRLCTNSSEEQTPFLQIVNQPALVSPLPILLGSPD